MTTTTLEKPSADGPSIDRIESVFADLDRIGDVIERIQERITDMRGRLTKADKSLPYIQQLDEILSEGTVLFKLVDNRLAEAYYSQANYKQEMQQ